MSDPILFLVLHEPDVAVARARVDELIVPDRRNPVRILGVPAEVPRSSKEFSAETKKLTALISAHPRHSGHKLVIGRDARCSHQELQSWWRNVEHGEAQVPTVAMKGIFKAIEDHSRHVGSHWHLHALAQVDRFESTSRDLDGWLEQFTRLDRHEIGRKIAARLVVLRTGDLPSAAFAIRETELIGQEQAFCYVPDDDMGGSWVEMQSILARTCPQGSVHPVRLDADTKRLVFPDLPVDGFVVHEDGLWSGRETVERLLALQSALPPVPVVFRFGVVTDFGLLIVRHAISSLGLNSHVRIDSSASELVRLVGGGLPTDLRLGRGMDLQTYDRELHRHVEPLAFRGADWTDEEVEWCRDVGAQLVTPWLADKLGHQPPAERVNLFALGAGGFASTTVFSRSVPKVCLPLLWRDGPVTVAGQHVNWRPLFPDARRMSTFDAARSNTRV